MTTLKYLLLVILLFPLLSAKGQNVYEINWKKENYYIAPGAISLGFGFFLVNKEVPMSLNRIQEIQNESVNGFDQWAIDRFSVSAQNTSDILLYTAFAYPLLLTIPKNTRNDLAEISVIYGETLLLTYGMTLLGKGIVNRPRPFVYNPDVDLEPKRSETAQFSFFSGHTSLTAANTFFAAKVFSDYYPDSKFRPFAWGIAAAIPAVTGYLRIEGGKHFPTDVIMGYAVGASAGILIPHFHKNRSKENNLSNLTILPGFNGMIVNYTF